MYCRAFLFLMTAAVAIPMLLRFIYRVCATFATLVMLLGALLVMELTFVGLIYVAYGLIIFVVATDHLWQLKGGDVNASAGASTSEYR
jgi:hypothetical protein